MNTSLNYIREEFLNFFAKNSHKVLPSDSLIPSNIDKSVLFTNSGMMQFKNFFTGAEKSNYNRITTSQKCLRAGGKHNDLENVGFTNRHHTFFEMLGNFSFGDYFKEEAISFAWEFLTKNLQIKKDKLYFTVYQDDNEAFNLWKKITGCSDDRITKISTDDNFWSMGDSGPCGPCSEIFFDLGDNVNIEGGKLSGKVGENDRYIEIWNLVFMQFEKDINLSRESYKKLPKCCVDTGMGLERICAVLDGKSDNYESPFFVALIDTIKQIYNISNKKQKEDKKTFYALRIIADHIRAISFLIADGILPGKIGRDYVLRRIMRRAMRYAHYLNDNNCLFALIFESLMTESGNSNMSNYFNELKINENLIKSTISSEEENFKHLLKRGNLILEEETENGKKNITGEAAFKLYDTFGFPLDLTKDFARENNLQIDEKGFEKLMEKQQELAKKNWKGGYNKDDLEKLTKIEMEFSRLNIEHSKPLYYEGEVWLKSPEIVALIDENYNLIIDDKIKNEVNKSDTISSASYLNIKQAREKIIQKLTEENLLVLEKTREITQTVKTAERSKTNLEILSTPQCYLQLLEFKEDFLILARDYLDFYPFHLKNRLIQWIEGVNQDWCISRNRFMGINPPKINNIKDEYLNFVFDTWFTSSVSPQINSRFISDNFKDEKFLKENTNFNEFIYPFSIRPQAHEIIRTWCFTTMVKAYLHGLTKQELEDRKKFLEKNSHLEKSEAVKEWFKENKFTKEEIELRFLPWKDVILSGWCLAEDKTKMSKSKGNILDPVNLLKEKTADSIRYWAASSSLGIDTPFSHEKVENGRKLINKLQNAFKFIVMQFDNARKSYENNNLLNKFDISFKFTNKNFDFKKFEQISKNYLFDQYYLAKFHLVLVGYDNYMQKYEFARAKDLIEEFFWKDFCDNYLEIVKTRSYGIEALVYKDKNLSVENRNGILEGQKSALITLIYLFEGILKLFSPFLPFITEEINEEVLKRNNEEWTEKNSIHRKGNWFSIERFYCKEAEDCEFAIEVLDYIRKEKSSRNLSIKAEIKELQIEKEIHKNLIRDFKSVINMDQDKEILISSPKRVVF